LELLINQLAELLADTFSSSSVTQAIQSNCSQAFIRLIIRVFSIGFKTNDDSDDEGTHHGHLKLLKKKRVNIT
jgi:hypothetical protein